MGRNDNGIWSVKNWNQLKSEAGFRVSLPRPWIYIYTCRMAFTRARAPIHRCTSKSMHRVPLVDIHWLLLHLQARFPFVFSLTYQRPTTTSHSPSPPIPSPCPRPTFDPFLLSPPLSIPVGGDQLVANKRNSSCCSRCFHFLSLLPSLPSYVDYNGIGTGLNLTSLRPPLTLFRVLRPSCHPWTAVWSLQEKT